MTIALARVWIYKTEREVRRVKSLEGVQLDEAYTFARLGGDRLARSLTVSAAGALSSPVCLSY